MKLYKPILPLILLFALWQTKAPVVAQVIVGNEQEYDIDYLTPKQYEIGGISFENAENFDPRMITLVAGLHVGDKIKVPGDHISTAIDNLWKQGMFEDVKIAVTRIQGNLIFLKIILKERPKLSVYSFKGVPKNDKEKLSDELKIKMGDVVTENLLVTTSNKIRNYYIEKGYTNAEVTAEMKPDTTGGKTDRAEIAYTVKRGKKVKIESIEIEGNEHISSSQLLRRLTHTHDVHYKKRMLFWTRGFWTRSKYREGEYNEDLAALINYYNAQGYRDARIVSDTVYQLPSEALNISEKKKAKQDRLKIKINIHEGKQFYFRNISFTGNTVYDSETLAKNLRINHGDPYNRTQLEQNITYNPAGTDISSMYMDNGYLFFNAQPVEVAVENDSIDIEIRIIEGKQARIRNVQVEGNTVTNDNIIIRELHTRPGDLFSRDAVLRSRRELVQLGYFKEENIIPDVKPNRDGGTVDVIYKVEEGQTSQINLQGGYGGKLFMLQVGLQLNNFSARKVFQKEAWDPFPAGDGQKLGVSVATSGKYYAGANISFTEPWLGGRRPQSLSAALYYNMQSNGLWYNSTSANYYKMQLLGLSTSLTKRLKWPDDYFILSHSLSYKRYNVSDASGQNLGLVFREGIANDISYGITLSRNSYDSPIYTRSGSDFSVSGALTPPYSALNGKDYGAAGITDQEKYRWIEYYKINIRGSWMLNMIGDLVLNARFRFGYMGYYNSDIGTSPFGRYYLGGDGLSTLMYDGRAVIPMRGYKNNSLTFPSQYEGASLFDRFTFELHHPIVESSAITLWGIGFVEGGNSWGNFKEFNPFDMYKSAGLGMRLYVPQLGLIGFDWGYGYNGSNGGNQFHFRIGTSMY